MAKKCVLYDRDCIDCGECEFCDLDPTKLCDNCGKCLENINMDYAAIKIMGLKDHMDKKDNFKLNNSYAHEKHFDDDCECEECDDDCNCEECNDDCCDNDCDCEHHSHNHWF